MSTRPKRNLGFLRSLSALAAVAILVASCGSPPPSARPNSSSSSLVIGGPASSPVAGVAAAPLPRSSFVADGDQINGWWWLRDAGGDQKATWTFSGAPAADQITLQLTVLATDTSGGKSGLAASFWLSFGGIMPEGTALTTTAESRLVTLPNTSPAGDPVGYTTSGTLTIDRAQLPAEAIGLWVKIGRTGSDGQVIPIQIAVQESSVQIKGLAEAPASGSIAAAPSSAPAPHTSFDVNGDEISGWWWLRDTAGNQQAVWGFFGVPNLDQIKVNLELLATDGVNGGPGINARFWLSFGAIAADGGAPPIGEPSLMTLSNTSPPGDPVGYTNTGSFTITRSQLPSGAIGLWVKIGRAGPDGSVVPVHIAVREASVQIAGLTGPTETSGPSSGPTAAPSTALYGPLTITTDCQQYSDAPLTVTGSAAPDLRLEFSPSASFSSVYANPDGRFALSPPSYTYDSMYKVALFPDGIWVRWAAAPSIMAHANNKGYCAGWTPQPTATATPEPTATTGPPTGTPTIVALGDSYISGEAGRWAGNSYDWYGFTDAGGSSAYYDNASGTAEVIAGCHRSRSAEVHIDRGGYGNVNTINLACSGATTQSQTSSSGDKPGVDLCPSDAYHDCPADLQGQATLLEAAAATHNVKLVVLSIGGNDFEFSDTVVQCSTDFVESSYFYDTDYCHDDGSVLARFTSANVSAVKTKLMNAYKDIVAAMRADHYADSDWSLLVQTYPSPLPPGGNIRYTEIGYSRFNNGCPFWDADADWANNTALPLINNTISNAVTDFSADSDFSGVDVHIMDVSQALVGHRLCEDTVGQVGITESVHSWTNAGASDGSEWVAQIRGIFSVGGKFPLPGSVYYKNESFHPNYWGQLALRNCLRQAWNNGAVRGGTCQFMQNGLNAFKEPTMILSQT